MPDQPLKGLRVFLSHASEDKALVRRLALLLHRNGIETFFDEWEIRTGDSLRRKIEEGISDCSHFIAVLSPASISKEWVNVEIDAGFVQKVSAQVKLIPVVYNLLPSQLHPLIAGMVYLKIDDSLAEAWRLVEEILDVPRKPPVELLTHSPRHKVGARADQDARYRDHLIRRVRSEWVDSVLTQPLTNMVHVELGLERKLDAVEHPLDLLGLHYDQTPRPLPSATPISAVYDEFCGELLILGAPGAGKTTLLVELAQSLLNRLERREFELLPIVLNLSSWAVGRLPLADWLVEEMNRIYRVDPGVARGWIDNQQIVPLLDGLDEVAREHRGACIDAINTFRRKYGLVPLVVCSRLADYETAFPARLQLFGAVAIQPLSREHIKCYLEKLGKPLAGVCTALEDDPSLWELLDSPLMLNIVTLVYHGRSAAQLQAVAALPERRTRLFEAYVDNMFARRAKSFHFSQLVYNREQIIHWLGWLARSMIRHDHAVFYIELMQPSWLPLRRQQRAFTLFISTIFAIILAFTGSVAFLIRDGPAFGFGSGILWLLIAISALPDVVGGVLCGLLNTLGLMTMGSHVSARLYRKVVTGLVFGLLSLLVVVTCWDVYEQYAALSIDAADINDFLKSMDYRQDLTIATHLTSVVLLVSSGVMSGTIFDFMGGNSQEIRPARTYWSWRAATKKAFKPKRYTRYVVSVLIWALAVSLLAGPTCPPGHTIDLIDIGVIVVILMLLCIVVYIPFAGAFGGMRMQEDIPPASPNEGIRQAAHGALVYGVGFWIFCSIMSGIFFYVAETPGVYSMACVYGMYFGMVAGMVGGGSHALRHIMLRLCLWYEGLIPRNYTDFLDYATELVFLYKVGGGYIFMHRLLMDYFADQFEWGRVHHVSQRGQKGGF